MRENERENEREKSRVLNIFFFFGHLFSVISVWIHGYPLEPDCLGLILYTLVPFIVIVILDIGRWAISALVVSF